MAICAPKLRLLCSIAFLTILHSTSAASAEPPRPAGSATDDLRWHLDHVLATSQTASFRALDPVGRRAEIRRIVTGLFDWSEMSRRALGAQWRERSGPERRAFATRFGALAEHAYMGQVEQLSARGVPPDPVRYLGESANGKETVVRTALMYPHEMPVDFLMSRRGARWQVTDVRVDGVSAAENYGAQFRRVTASESFAGLVDRMIEKADAAPRDTHGAAQR